MSPHANDLVRVASLIGNPARASILSHLLDGTFRTAGELARAAKVTPQTASSHLAKLVQGGLLAVEPQGRHRYFRLAGPQVAQVLEALSLLAPSRGWSTRAPPALRFARTCYDHLAGWLGVAVADGLERKGFLETGPDAYLLTRTGEAYFRHLGVEVPSIAAGDGVRPSAKRCLDWSERRPHLGGALGRALTSRLLAHRYLAVTTEPRALRLTTNGRAVLEQQLGLRLGDAPIP